MMLESKKKKNGIKSNQPTATKPTNFTTLKNYQCDVDEAQTPFLEDPEVAKCKVPTTSKEIL